MKHAMWLEEIRNRNDMTHLAVRIDWTTQEDLEGQLQTVRRFYGVFRQEMEQVPGGSQSCAYGVMLLTCNLLHRAAETIEDRIADKLGERHG